LDSSGDNIKYDIFDEKVLRSLNVLQLIMKVHWGIKFSKWIFIIWMIFILASLILPYLKAFWKYPSN